MYDRSDGCLLILLSVGVASLLTLFVFFMGMGDPVSGTHRGSSTPLVLLCLGAWVFTFGVILAEAIHDQRRPRR